MNPIKRAFMASCACCVSLTVQAQQHDHEHVHTAATEETGDSERDHVAPDPPSQTMPDMRYREMVGVMDMDDRKPYHRFLLNKLEAQRADGDTNAAWDGEFFWGGDYDKIGIKSEGEESKGNIDNGRVELVWDRIVSRWWSAQLGVRHEWSEGPTRDWLALGTQGLAPYFFDIEATAYLGESGRTALRFKADYEVLLTQRLILQPETELNLYGKDDSERRVMSGISDLEAGLRLRYEIRREIAPYLGVSWAQTLGRTSDLRRAQGEASGQWKVLVGLRLNF